MNALRSVRPVLVATILITGLLAPFAGPAVAAGDEPGGLQALIDAAEPGDELTLTAGTYDGGITIDKPLTINGKGWPVIDGHGNGSVITVVSPDVTIRGVVIANSGKRLDREDSGITSDLSPGLSIIGNRFENVLFGMFLRHAHGAEIRDNEIGGMDLFIARRGDGIRIWQSTDAVVEGNHVANGRDSVFWFADGVTVRNNHVQDGRYGLHFMYSDGAVVEGNVLEDNSVGAFLMYSTDLTMTGNVFRSNRGPSGYGLGLKDVDGLMVSGNRFVENRVGLYADNSPSKVDLYHRVESNVFAFNNIGVLLGSTVARNVFTGNAFIDNGVQVASDSTGNLLDNEWSFEGVGNHWSDFAGFDADSDGIGDIVYEIDNLFTDLIERYPEIAFFAGTPAAQAVDMASQTFPSLRPEPILTDDSPLIRIPSFPPAPMAGEATSRLFVLMVSLGLLGAAVSVMAGGRSRFRGQAVPGGTT
ncbi:MAG: nitrous oxide reductase family maturation protein NosD [Actinobacteria bacterium]|jgi:nitrous oxidase accessory protein|nr:nitrous oxide reductase family maturation protein NosD [Actinomycetota bacterium]MBT4279803.1 nitrous oxide reductase family maturation protein NosD [Actinomycetota bacterium]MBT4785679.1 nitrous oxide reductase family maturation protein NosD [Actinomycetota bacterium]MBT5041494.1 nitrous oxide reductase family maturation protein NosD [Actinomycetota bacterium]MBT6213106.1 nitrous oxide reductase family maturation protein NosD [Actinomycetota bacterium]